MEQKFYDAVESSPVIAAVKDDEGLKKACRMKEMNVIFVLYGDICNIGDIVDHIKESGKIAMVHMDLISGLSSKDVAVEFLQKHTAADGIITTKPNLIKKAKLLGLYTILRFFVIDSIALDNIYNLGRQRPEQKPDFVEILPGVMPKIVKRVGKASGLPVIASGLITDKEDVMSALEAGAISISTTNQRVWLM